MTLPTVFWSIPCFDKRREQPFPVYSRLFVLDWNALNNQQIVDVLSIVQPKQKSLGPSSPKTSVISISRAHKLPDDRMLAYRKYFFEKVDTRDNDQTSAQQSFVFVNLNREYFEDERGEEISHYAMIQHVSGQQEPIILGHPESILRLALSSPINVSQWSEESANTIAQFLDVVERICGSKWHRRPSVFTFEFKSGGDSAKFPSAADSELLEAIFPDHTETVAVLAYFRQLHAADRLFNRTCEVFIRTCGDKRKTLWMTEQLKLFKQMIDSSPVPFTELGTRREIIKMFMYGAGLLHASSNDGADLRLSEMIGKHGKHRVVMVFNNCLWDILSEAVSIYHVVQREYDYWVNSCGLAKPTRIDIPSLFEGFVKA